MSEFKIVCTKFFGSTNFYEILKVSPTASDKEIKKAYHKLSLCVHPDRVEEDQKKVATEKFQVLGKIHSILQDDTKRKLYDDFGEFDEEIDASFNWVDYWRSMFKKIDIKDIENYEKEYIGSEIELKDIKKAYISTRGNMDGILEMVPFSNCDSEERIIKIVQSFVEKGEVEKYNSFFNENKSRKIKRRKKWEKEKQETELINMKDLEKDMEKSMKRRGEEYYNLLSEIEDKFVSKRKRMNITSGSIKQKESKSDKNKKKQKN
ncbi:J domain-containing protein CG6693 [Anoplophora glabripennis]|nr:J domain-containing protein CG6693 [Anoplophora glabripennis]